MSQPIVIIGAGVAGLSCALQISKAGHDVLVVDSADRPGGRMKTDIVDGFRLDRGFQVYLTAYKHGRRVLDADSLDLRAFEPGALVWDGRGLNLVHRTKKFSMALSGYLTVRDKLKILEWNKVVDSMSVAAIWEMPDMSTERHLIEYGFTNEFLERFARPFFGGIFLDRSLQVSRRMFTFVWKMLLEGDTAIPALGIEEIPRNLASQLPSDSLRMNSMVSEVVITGGKAAGVKLASGDVLNAAAVVIATDAQAVWQFTGMELPHTYRASTCLYFHAPESPTQKPLLVLNGQGSGLVNHVTPCSVVSEALAPKGEHLVSATILGTPQTDDADLAAGVKADLSKWFPDARVSRWRHLRTYRVLRAQFDQPPLFRDQRPSQSTATPGLYLAGEFTESSSIDGAIRSGTTCANLVLSHL